MTAAAEIPRFTPVVLAPFFAPLEVEAPPVVCWSPIRRLNLELWDTVDATTPTPYDFQPIFDPRTREVRAYEALYRGDFATVHWIEADTQLLRLLGKHCAGVRLFINLSIETILKIDERIVIAAARRNEVILEWTESHCSDRQFAEVATRLNRWIKRGCSVAIDDFGRGEDGTRRMLALDRVESVKLDGTMIRSMIAHPFGHAVVPGLVRICHQIGAKVVAECIETAEMMVYSQTQGIDLVQGFYLDGQRGRPTNDFVGAASIVF